MRNTNILKKLSIFFQDKYFLFERLLTHEKPPPKKSSKKLTDTPSQQQQQTSLLSGTVSSAAGEVKVPKKRGPKPKKKLLDERVPMPDDSMSLPPPLTVRTVPPPAGQSLLKLKLSSPTGRVSNYMLLTLSKNTWLSY